MYLWPLYLVLRLKSDMPAAIRWIFTNIVNQINTECCQTAHLMEVFATTSTIATEINVREKAPKEMSICFRSVLFHKLNNKYNIHSTLSTVKQSSLLLSVSQNTIPAQT